MNIFLWVVAGILILVSIVVLVAALAVKEAEKQIKRDDLEFKIQSKEREEAYITEQREQELCREQELEDMRVEQLRIEEKLKREARITPTAKPSRPEPARVSRPAVSDSQKRAIPSAWSDRSLYDFDDSNRYSSSSSSSCGSSSSSSSYDSSSSSSSSSDSGGGGGSCD